MSLLFSPYTLNSPRGPLGLANRIVVAPMCQYSASNGEATDWHLMHWGNLLNSGAALFIIEATGVTPEARITPACLGLWDDRTEAALRDKLIRARKLVPATPVFIQLAHAPNMKIYLEEIFRPVLSCVRVANFTDALNLVNFCEYGNGVACFTSDGNIAREFARRVQVGMVGINVPIPAPMAWLWRLEKIALWRYARLQQRRCALLYQTKKCDATLARKHRKRC